MAKDIEQTLAGVGARLRTLRMRRELTLADVSRESGISVSTLSRLESGTRRPALELLLPLARVYDVPLDDLVGAPEVGDPRVHIRRIPHRGGVLLPLSGRAGGIRVVKQILPPPKRGERVELKTHRGHEWLYVMSGRLRLVLGERDFVLEAGEAAEFDTRTPHWIGAADGAVELLHISGAEGQRIHMPELESPLDGGFETQPAAAPQPPRQSGG